MSYLSQLQEHEHVPIDVHHHLCCLHQTGDSVLLCGGHAGLQGGWDGVAANALSCHQAWGQGEDPVLLQPP